MKRKGSIRKPKSPGPLINDGGHEVAEAMKAPIHFEPQGTMRRQLCFGFVSVVEQISIVSIVLTIPNMKSS